MIREEKIQIPFKYAAGKSGSRFLATLRDSQRILGSKCPACGHVSVPLKSFCPSCGRDDLAEIGLPADGTLISWTETPVRGAFALVRLGDEGATLLHRLIDPPTGLSAGARVSARFADTPKGHISDLQGFVVVGDRS